MLLARKKEIYGARAAQPVPARNDPRKSGDLYANGPHRGQQVLRLRYHFNGAVGHFRQGAYVRNDPRESGDLHGERPHGRREVLRLRRNAPKAGDDPRPRARSRRMDGDPGADAQRGRRRAAHLLPLRQGGDADHPCFGGLIGRRDRRRCRRQYCGYDAPCLRRPCAPL